MADRAELTVSAVRGMPEIVPGDDIAALIVRVVGQNASVPQDGDVVVVAQKIVSKAEGAIVRLEDVAPSAFAVEWAAGYGKDPRVVEVVLREARRIVRMDHGVLIAETRHGLVCANAGVDASNVARGFVTLLPRDPDASAERIRAAVASALGIRLAVVVADTFGRPWREGVVNVAVGVAGLRPLLDYRGCVDAHGRRLESTVIAVADEIASAAELVMRKTARTPVAIVRGAGEWLGDGSSRELARDPERDMFR